MTTASARTTKLSSLFSLGLWFALPACSTEPAVVPDRGADAATGDRPTVADRGVDMAPDRGGDIALPASPFGTPVVLSDPAVAAFSPSVAASGAAVLVAWHQFDAAGMHVMFRLDRQGSLGAPQPVPDTVTDQKLASAAGTATGFVIAYEATDGTASVIRTIDLDADGKPGSPTTLVSGGHQPRVAAAGDEVAWAWTDGKAHYFARRGTIENVTGTPVGTTLISTGILNYPRIALDATGTLFVAYRDGGTDTIDWDVLLLTRPAGGPFSAAVNVSHSPQLLSDDISLALEEDGTLDIAWVDQDASNVQSFEVQYATRAPDGTVSAPKRYATQGLWSWTPSVVPGLKAVWNTGSGAKGPLYYGEPGQPPIPILAPLEGNLPSLVRDSAGRLHLAFCDNAAKQRVQYAVSIAE